MEIKNRRIFIYSVVGVLFFLFIECNNGSKNNNPKSTQNKEVPYSKKVEKVLSLIENNKENFLFLKFWKNMSYDDFLIVKSLLISDGEILENSYINFSLADIHGKDSEIEFKINMLFKDNFLYGVELKEQHRHPCPLNLENLSSLGQSNTNERTEPCPNKMVYKPLLSLYKDKYGEPKLIEKIEEKPPKKVQGMDMHILFPGSELWQFPPNNGKIIEIYYTTTKNKKKRINFNNYTITYYSLEYMLNKENEEVKLKNNEIKKFEEAKKQTIDEI